MSILFEWRIRDIERMAQEAKGRLHEIDTLRGDVSRLEYSLRDARAEIDGLRSQLQEVQESLERLRYDNPEVKA